MVQRAQRHKSRGTYIVPRARDVSPRDDALKVQIGASK